MDNPIVVRLPTIDEIARRWIDLELMLKRATDTTCCYEPVDLLRTVMLGQMAMWFVEDGDKLLATLVTEVKQYPRRRILECPFIAGHGIERWHRVLMAALEDHARKFGCSHIAGSGRGGWLKFGFQKGGEFWVRPLGSKV